MNTCVKLAWNGPRWTKNYFVDNLLAGNIPSARKKILCQYVNFFQSLRKSPLKEVRILFSIVGRESCSVTGKNLALLEKEFKLDPWVTSGSF